MPKTKSKRKAPPRSPYMPPAGFKPSYPDVAAAAVAIIEFGIRNGHNLNECSRRLVATENRAKASNDRIPVTDERESYLSWACLPDCTTNVHARRTRRSEQGIGPVVVTLSGPQRCVHPHVPFLAPLNQAAADGHARRHQHDGEAMTDESEEEEKEDDGADHGLDLAAEQDNEDEIQFIGPEDLESAIARMQAELRTLRGDQDDKFTRVSQRLSELERLLIVKKRPGFYSH